MFGCSRWQTSFASVMNMRRNSVSSANCGRMRLMTRFFSNPIAPKTFELKISAIPPVAIFSTSR